ncbi:vitamin K epoxide reductase family protein [Flaviflexus huanghaiensis]|uniref:vitamin K epoxide reductase family protein n=1 Tax=Flaviflexus huanghaiensis TaxID=1111473 RepID=UPI0015FAA15E|nr:vitamin K epoxide reductase family protein [Flaviflexus huanghaiensis]
MTDFDNMTDDEIEAYLAAGEVERPPAPGAAEFGLLMIVSGLLGAFASLQLLLSQRALESDPFASLSCDVNEILSCSTFLTSWEGNVLGFSNSYLGLVGFAAMAVMGVYLLVRKALASFMWVAMAAAAAAGVLALAWFQYTSFSAETLCPWCLVIWVALVPFIVHASGQAHANLTDGTSRVWRYRWLMIGIWFLALLAFTFVYFIDTWRVVLGWE